MNKLLDIYSNLRKVELFLFFCSIVVAQLPAAVYFPDRIAFPACCEDHFDNNKSTKLTWMEPADHHFIESLKGYLQYIPRHHLAECFECAQCGGLGLCLYYQNDQLTDIDANKEIHKSHQHIQKNQLYTCEMGDNFHDDLLCWEGGYFRKWNHKFSHFFQHYLHYCSENNKCQCYWPEKSLKAVEINNAVYNLIRGLCEDGLIDFRFSPYWVAQHIIFDYDRKYYGEYYYPNEHGMASSLTTYTFFYSQYYQLLSSLASHIEANFAKRALEATDNIDETMEFVRDNCLHMYNKCLNKHPHPKIYYERGMIKMHSGDLEEALYDIHQMMKLSEENQFESALTSEMYQQEGEAYAEIGMYDVAVIALTEAIRRDPNNKEAYFHRAAAYFELGDFDEALKDYLLSDKGKGLQKSFFEASKEFSEALLTNASLGAAEAAVDFFPSLCSSAYGLSRTLWTTVQHPIESTKNFASACYRMGECIVDYCKTIDWDTVEDYAKEIKTLYEDFYSLNEKEKGELIGFIIGKYGVDIFAGGACVKGVAAYRNLKAANRICNLESMVISSANTEAIVASSLKHKSKKEAFFKNVKLEWDKQNKHIIGKHNFELGKSEFVHSNPQALLSNFAGKGKPVNNKMPGKPDYRERVDFGEFIGYYVNQENPGIKLPTTKGTIRYSKKGAHIIPSHPEGK